MEYEIPQDILDATNCPKMYTCLTDVYCKNHAMCEVNYRSGKYVTFLKPGVSQEVLQQCPYAFTSRYGVKCKCPVRYYLNKEYGI